LQVQNIFRFIDVFLPSCVKGGLQFFAIEKILLWQSLPAANKNEGAAEKGRKGCIPYKQEKEMG